MQSKSKTVTEYLKELPADRRAAIATVRSVILANLDAHVREDHSVATYESALDQWARWLAWFDVHVKVQRPTFTP